MRHAALLSTALGLAPLACAALLGIDELRDAQSSTTAAGAGGQAGSTTSSTVTGGMAGAGGGGASGVAAPDWTNSFTAVYRFELASPQLGLDATDAALDLTEDGTLAQDTQLSMEGAASLSVLAGRLHSSDTAFAANAVSLTFGGWFRIDDVGPMQAVSRAQGTQGYQLGRPGQSATCAIGVGGILYEVVAATPWEAAVWVHVACRYDVTSGRIDVFVNGSPAGEQVAFGTVEDPAVPFQLSWELAPFVGWMDEVFFARAPLGDSAIRRVWACGIRGARCRCSEADPADYESCGLTSDCGALPQCNWPEPP